MDLRVCSRRKIYLFWMRLLERILVSSRFLCVNLSISVYHQQEVSSLERGWMSPTFFTLIMILYYVSYKPLNVYLHVGRKESGAHIA